MNSGENVNMNHGTFPVFDGHNDVLTRLWLSDHNNPAQAFIRDRLAGHLDLTRCQQAGFVGGMFAIFLPPYSYVQQYHPNKLFDPTASDFTQQQIEQICLEQLDLAKQLAQYSNNIQICTTVQDIQHCLTQQKLAIVLHMEGAEALQLNPDLLDVFYETGLRSIGPLWNRPSRFGHGLNAKFPHSRIQEKVLHTRVKHL